MPRQYFFWKYLNTIIVLYCIIVQKNPIFVQLSPIQCTYSNIFIRFFKFFPANTNIYQNSYSVIGVLCGLRQGVLSSQCGHLISFGTKYLMSLQYGFPSGRYVINCAFDQTIAVNVNCLSFACLFLFPTGTKVSRGVPLFPLAMTKYFVRKGNRFKND